MSGLIDTNVLIYAANRAVPQFKGANLFLNTMMESSHVLYLCWPVIYEFLRVSTHQKVFHKPLTWSQAREFISTLIAEPNVQFLLESDDHWRVLHDSLTDVRQPNGNFFYDAHIAAIAKENGVTVIYTCDRDFRAFPFLKVIDPLSPLNLH